MLSSVRSLVWFGVLLLMVHLGSPCACAQIRDGGIDPSNLGKGDWVYSITDATNKLSGHVGGVTNETSLMLYYKGQGIRYMVVKAGTGATLFNGCYAFPQLTTYLVNVAHANGIVIFGYNRSYATNTAGESAIADFCFNQGCDGFIWDAESEWESGTIGTQGPALAWSQCSIVRSNWPNKFLAHSPFAIIGVHTSFPFKEFGFWCDAVMPQIYHFSTAGLKRSVSAAINWTDVNWTTYQNSWASLPPTNINGVAVYWTNAIKPLAPIQDVYGTGSAPTCEGTASAYPAKDVMEFMDYLAADPNPPTAGGCKGALYYRTDLHDATQWAYIKAGTSGIFTGQVNNVVIDSPKATTVGSWTTVVTFSATTTSPSFIGNGSGTDTNSFGTGYLSKGQGTGASYAQFTPNILVPGDYNVYQWHPSLTNASASVPFVIIYNGGSTTVYANQQTNDGNWSFLGKFNFLAGAGGRIRVSDAVAESTAVAIADGVKLVYVPPSSAPAQPTGLNATPLSSSQIALAWNDIATNELAYIVARGSVSNGPYADLASLPANSTNYTDTGLTASTTYYYVVRATNILGASSYSAQAAATTYAPPSAPGIATQPQSQTVIASQPATFSVNATGSPPLRFEWKFNSAPIQGATNSAFTRTNAQLGDTGNYLVVVTNSLGAATSAPASLTIRYTLAATATTGGAVAKSPDQPSYSPNSTVTLSATASNGYLFAGWTGDASGTSNPLTLLLQTNEAVTANFLITNGFHLDGLEVLADGRAQVQISGDPAHYAMDGAANLLDWRELTNFFVSNSPFLFIDADSNQSRRFYRGRRIP